MRENTILAVLSVILLTVAVGTMGWTATMNITNTNDGGPGSLREAITQANTNGEDDNINLPAGEYILTGGSLVIDSPNIITIVGEGAGTTIIDGNHKDRVFYIRNGRVTISSVTVRNGKSGKAEHGGGIYNEGEATFIDCNIFNNITGNGFDAVNGSSDGGDAGDGGGIYNSNILTLTNCSISNNLTGKGGYSENITGESGSGGGICNVGETTIINCCIKNNFTGDGLDSGDYYYNGGDTGDGGGVFNSNILTLINSSISNNCTGVGAGEEFSGCSGNGGGLYNGNKLNITNCSIYNNRTGDGCTYALYGGGTGDGGGIFNRGETTLTNSTVSNNNTGKAFAGPNCGPLSGSGGGISSNYGKLTVTNCTITDNYTGDGPILCCFLGSPAGSGGGIYGGTINLKNSIIANNYLGWSWPDYVQDSIGPDCCGTANSMGYNLIENIEGCNITGITAGNFTGIDPMLDSLADNGGITLTHALLPGSPAIDAGNSSGISVDQRGYFRPFNIAAVPNASDGADIGAYEYGSSSNLYSVSGKVTCGGVPVQGVNIAFSHDGHSLATDVDGNYSYNVIEGITTTVTPSHPGYRLWSPANKTFENISSNQVQNFDGIAYTFSISGIVKDGQKRLPGVKIRFSHDGHTSTTNASGRYSHIVSYGTSTTVTPFKEGYGSWNPASMTFYDIGSNQAQNFYGSLNKYTISGTVTDGSNPVEDAAITFSHDGHTEMTNAGGFYSYVVYRGTTTTVTAAKAGYTFEPSGYSFNSLSEDKPNRDFTAHNVLSVTVANPKDGETVTGVIFIDTDVVVQNGNKTGSGNSPVSYVEFFIDGVSVKQDTRAPYRCRWDTRRESNGSHAIKAEAVLSNGLTEQHQIAVNVNNSIDPPHIVLNRTHLNFGAVIGEDHTGLQGFLVGNCGGGTLDSSVSCSHTWIIAEPSHAAGELVEVSVEPAGLSPGRYAGTVIITDDNADNSPVSVDIYLEVMGKSREQPLTGAIDSPRDSAEVCSIIPVTGWAVDDIEITRVKLFRNPVNSGEPGNVFLGDADFVEGARPDIETQYSQYPNHYRAGWCGQVVTNLFPNGGNGTFVISAVGIDCTGNEVVLGSKTIICDNANATKPFGTIDTPKQGGTASGMDYVNFGWALTPRPNTIPVDGSTIKVWVDGVALSGTPVYNRYRKDIADAFPGYNNSNGAVGYYNLDTTLYENGVHTISWSVMDDAGNSDGIGSRYFTVMNGTGGSSHSNVPGYIYGYLDKLTNEMAAAPQSPVLIKKGYVTGIETKRQTKVIYPDKNGIITVKIIENQRVEIMIEPHCRGYLVVDGQLRGLPAGSSLDSGRGVFYWQPGPGFIGTYRLVFIEDGCNDRMNRRNLNHPEKKKILLVSISVN